MFHPYEVGLAGGRAASEAAARLIERLSPEYRVGRIQTGARPCGAGGADTPSIRLHWEHETSACSLLGPAPSAALRHSAADDCDWVLVLGDAAADLPHIRIAGADIDSRGPVLADVDGADTDRLARVILDHLRTRAARTPLCGLVLAGGRSSRMGRDKALLSVHGQTQLERAAALLSPYCAKAFVSCRHDQAEQPHFRAFEQVHDRFLDCGPSGGILSAMTAFPESAWLVVACDLPLLDPDTLAELIRRRDPLRTATAYLSSTDGLPEPLCAIYEPRARSRLLRQLATGKPCPRKVLIQSHPRLLTLGRPRALSNMNSPQEYREAVEAGGEA